ncbi:MAG TPA: sigma-70 family RNA polymerase sigma factor [Candidatus Dojkabacteria bacterium]|nr:sigma-70 family RNA polymerase sigma factor [Candidatus Dojkabacteria bacterium]
MQTLENDNPKNIDDVYEKYINLVFRFVYSRTRNKHISEDVTSEVFLKVVRNWTKFNQQKASIGTWIFTIMQNTLIDYFRKNKNQRLTQALDEETEELEEQCNKTRDDYVQIDSAFKNELHQKILNEMKEVQLSKKDTSKFTSIHMSSLLQKLNSFPKFTYFLAGILITALVGVFTFYMIENGKKDNTLTPINQKETAIAQLFTNDGNVTIVRGEQESIYNSDTEVFANDEIITSSDTIADLKTQYGRVSIDVNSSITLQNDGFPLINKGTVFISSENNYEQAISSQTQFAEITIENGATLITHIPEIASTTGLIPRAFADEESQTKIVSVNGKISVKVNNELKVLENGEQIIVKKESDPILLTKDEIDKELFKSEFFTEVAEKENKEQKNLGIASDLIPPSITVSSLANNSTTSSNTTTVNLISNEDGWYYNGSWNELIKDTEISYPISLHEGANSIFIKVKDKSYNITTQTITVTYTPPTPTPVEPKISLTGKVTSDGVNLTWTVTSLNTDKGFKIVKSTEINPVYPGNEYIYLTEGTKRSYSWKITDEKTYYIRVRKYEGSLPSIYSNQIIATAPTAP